MFIAVRKSNSKSAIMSSYIMGSHFAFMVEPMRIFDMSAVQLFPPPPQNWLPVSIEQPRKYTELPRSLKTSVVLLLFYFKQTVTVTVPLPSTYCSIGSGRHTHRCFLWGSNYAFKACHKAFMSYSSLPSPCVCILGTERSRPTRHFN
jgi:hypothetical protein